MVVRTKLFEARIDLRPQFVPMGLCYSVGGRELLIAHILWSCCQEVRSR